MTVNLIAAVGRRGQIGKTSGEMPWGMQEKADLNFFQQMTIGRCVIFGKRTAEGFPHKDKTGLPILLNREVLVWDGCDPKDTLSIAYRSMSNRQIFVAGGAKTYRAFAPYVNGLFLLSQINYDNDPSDDKDHVFFPFDAYGIVQGGKP